jgi:hypothetical protein
MFGSFPSMRVRASIRSIGYEVTTGHGPYTERHWPPSHPELEMIAGRLPIQQPDKYILTINLRTAKALGLIRHGSWFRSQYTVGPLIDPRRDPVARRAPDLPGFHGPDAAVAWSPRR